MANKTAKKGLRLELENSVRHLRYSSRRLRRDPLFTIIVTLTLTLGVGCNAAIFSVMRTLLLRALPVPHPEQLIRIALNLSGREIPLSGPMFDALRSYEGAIPEMMAWAPFETFLDENGRSQSIDGALISGNGFSVLRLQPALGRLLNISDDTPGGGPDGYAGVISARFWRRHFGGSPSVLKQRMVINGVPVTIVGVMPPKFGGMVIGSSPDIVLPLEFEVRASGRFSQRHFAGSTWLMVFGRRDANLSLSKAAAQLQSLAPAVLRQAVATLPAATQNELLSQLRLVIYSGRTGTAGEENFRGENLRDLYKRPILAVQALACLLLFLCIGNLIVLQFARTGVRQREFAISSSLGAGRSQIWPNMVADSVLLGVLGGITAIAIGRLLNSALAAFLARQQENWLMEAGPDWTVISIIFVTTTACTLFSSIVPTLLNYRGDLAGLLKPGSRTTAAGGRGISTGQLLIPLQVSLCMVLLVAAGLFMSTVLRLLAVPMGFDPNGVLLFPFNVRPDSTTMAHEKMVETKVIQRLRSTHWASAASSLDVVPVGGGSPTTEVRSTGAQPKIDRQTPINAIGPDYLKVMHIRLLQGREFRANDTLNSPPVCMVSRSAAQYFFPRESTFGRRLLMPPPRSPSVPPSCEVVGVTEDTKFNDLRATFPRLIYIDAAQSPFPVHYIVVRSKNVEATANEFGQIMHQESPATRVSEPKLFTDQIRNTIGSERLLGAVGSLFAALAVLLTGVGLYGFLSWSVVRRTSEIGIRMAIGADARTVVLMISRQTFVLVAIGVTVGAIASYLLTRFATAMLYGTSATDPVILSSAVAILLALSVLATWLPARHAALLEPSLALRNE